MEYGSLPLSLVCNVITRTIPEENFKNLMTPAEEPNVSVYLVLLF